MEVHVPDFNPMVLTEAQEIGIYPMVSIRFVKKIWATGGLQLGYGWATNKKGSPK
jgi:hypothetical protein